METNYLNMKENETMPKSKNKFLTITKVKTFNEDLLKKNQILFDNFQTFLKLPNEMSFNYAINNYPNMDEKSSPISYIENPIKKSKKLKPRFSNSSRHSSMKTSDTFRPREINFNKFTFMRCDKFLSDKEIQKIFSDYKNNIQKNKIKYKNDLISEDECPKVMKNIIDKNLSLQEKCLKKNEYNMNLYKTIEENIRNKMKLKLNKNKNKKTINYDINFSNGELLMNSGEEFRTKKQEIYLHDKNNNKQNILPNINNNWVMSLRNPDNIKLKKFNNKNLNKSHKNKNTFDEENSKKFNENSIIQTLPSKNCTIQNLINNQWKNNNRLNGCLSSNGIKHNYTYDVLEIKGEKLIDFEENMFKKLKGKKKLVNLKINKNEIKNLNIFSNFSYK